MEYKLKPWKHQKRVIDRIAYDKRKFYALFHDMGAGKTKTATELLRLKCTEHKRQLKTLIICPVAVLENWKREIITHSYIEDKNIQIIDGMSPVNYRDKTLKNPSKKRIAEQLNSGKDIFIMNTEKVGLSSLWDDIYRFSPEFLIIDESHRFKDALGKRVKALHKFLDKVNPRYRFILTGSPILNSPLDIWSQFYILSPDIFGRNFYSFRSEYFYDANAGMPSNVHFPNWKVKDNKFYRSIGYPDRDDKFTTSRLNTVIYSHADRVMKKDVLDLPPIVYQKLEVPLTKEQVKIYNDMEQEAIAFINNVDAKSIKAIDKLLAGDFEDLDNAMTADTALVRILRLQQIIAGIFTTDDGELEHIKNNRLKVLKDTLQEILAGDNKIILWTVFKSTYEPIQNLCEELGVNYTMLTGLQSTIEKQANIDKFNNDKDCRVIIANQGAGGTGVNLTAANYSIYYTRSFKLEHDLQSEARNYRGGQNRSVTRIDLVTSGTIDSEILVALEDKKMMAEDILEVKNDFTASEVLSLLKR